MVLRPQIRVPKGREYDPATVPEIYAFLNGHVQVCRSSFSKMSLIQTLLHLSRHTSDMFERAFFSQLFFFFNASSPQMVLLAQITPLASLW